ncbi:uncharacterized protein LOC111630126 [Centruroides sculpturatus]|uniref:uncharacterized protein LOC111630126 n=1 Tax=Centruroides sculpturatus TaxID=218467 RepID=UPI000C6D23EE|nr:uncharacterized protein LOC111630126 [Centruroides sculpturatus]
MVIRLMHQGQSHVSNVRNESAQPYKNRKRRRQKQNRGQGDLPKESTSTSVLDSMGKPSAGMLGITPWIRGDYDQCLNIDSGRSSKLRNSKNINGKYCLLENIAKPTSISNLLKVSSSFRVEFRFDICIPSDCHENDLSSILNWLLGSELSARVDYCKEKNQKVVYSTAQIICLSFFGFFSSWVVLATFVETLMELGIISSSGKRDIATMNLIFVSLYQSIRKLRSHCIRDRTAAFCGMKFSLMCILIFFHIFVMLPNEPVEKYKNIPELYDYIPVEISTASFPMMEIFFFISAFLLSYSNQNSVKSAMDILVLLRKRIIR